MYEHPVPTLPKPCVHELKFCKKCDVVYCEKCSGEWVKKPPFSFDDIKKEYEKIERQRPIRPWPNPEMWPPTEKRVMCIHEESHS